MAHQTTAKSQRSRAALPRIVPAIPFALGSKIRNKHEQNRVESRTEDIEHVVLQISHEDHAGAIEIKDDEAVEQPIAACVNGSLTPPANTVDADTVEAGELATPVNSETFELEKGNESPPSSAEPKHGITSNQPTNLDNDGDQAPEMETSLLPDTNNTHLAQPFVQELPAAFYPGHHHHYSNPSSATATSVQQGPLLTGLKMHQPQLSTNSLVFGGYRDSANSSPSAGPPFNGPHCYSQPPYLGYDAPPFGSSPFFPGGHSHHVSQPYVGPMFPPPFLHNAPSTLGYPPDFYNNSPSPFGQSRYLVPSNARFPNSTRRPDDYPTHQRFPVPSPRFLPTSQPMQVPTRIPDIGNDQTKAIHADLMTPLTATIDSVPENQQPNHAPYSLDMHGDERRTMLGNSNRGRSMPDFPSRPTAVEDSIALSQYLHGQFGNRDFADYVIQLSHSSYLFPPTALPCHGVVLARSPNLRSLMAMQNSGHHTYPKILNIVVSDRFLNHDVAFMEALMRLYGEILPDQAFVSGLRCDPTGYGPVQRMRFALAYAAAGHFLQIDEIITHGLDLAAGLLSWKTIERALAFALEGGLSSAWGPFETFGEDRGSSSSNDESTVKYDLPSSAPNYGIYSDRILSDVIEFIAHNCPTDFKFFPNAPQSFEVPRLPSVAEPQHSRRGSRFSQIRFGEMMLEEDTANPATITMSTILVSLPFPTLVHLLDHRVICGKLGWLKVAQTMQAVVDEREARRQRTVRNRTGHAPGSTFEDRLWNSARQAESVERTENHPAGVRLSRRRAGVETPPSTSSTKS